MLATLTVDHALGDGPLVLLLALLPPALIRWVVLVSSRCVAVARQGGVFL
ncbi:MAG TPA: hypothetical protein VKE41_16020 [Roseiflexaceae bacterium]|nr:hypothetical protein [Roseiflexaceae bacterium]